jgi:hypothetical protein
MISVRQATPSPQQVQSSPQGRLLGERWVFLRTKISAAKAHKHRDSTDQPAPHNKFHRSK